MTSVLVRTVRERLGDLEPYRPGRAPRDGIRGRISSNEAPLGAAPAVRLEVTRCAGEVHRYPSSRAARTALAAALGIDEDQVLLTNGSDELCYLIAALAVRPGTIAVVADPPYRIAEIASRVAGAGIVRVPVRADGTMDLPAMARAAVPGSLLWVTTPHNPTGAAVRPEELELLVDTTPADAVVVIDEAYRGYCDPELLADTVSWATSRGNVVVQRTFSKDYGLAGLRVGYAVATREVIGAIEAIKPPFDLNAVAAAAVVAALGAEDWRAYGVAQVREERARLERLLDRLGIGHFPSQANFVTLAIAHDRLAEPLEDVGLTVRPGDDLGLPGWTRISIGTPAQMALVRMALAEVVASAGGGIRA